MNLLDDIPDGALIALATVVWIYEVEAHPVYGPIVRPFFRDRMDTRINRAGSSLLALGELLVQPLSVGRSDLVDQYRAFFKSDDSFTVWDVNRDGVELAASLRAKHRLKMLDALHVAAALQNGAEIFLTNDAEIRRVPGIKILILADYVPQAP